MAESIAQALVSFFGDTIPAELTIFLISLLPILELRGGMIAAALLGVNFTKAFLICLVGNLLPIPFILWLIRPFFNWLKTTRHLKKVADWLERKTEKNKEKVLKYEVLGLLLFVAIPLPGTGGWTGALVAAMLDMPMKKSLPIIALGVLIAGFIMSAITYGLPALLGF
ncbi:MAG: small multi-drug export protein [Ruminococcaceae bacterium]|nr:small multi-drug export protein [Oscillospiraceae bacterium]